MRIEERRTVVVGANLERLVAAHDDTDLLGLLMLEQANIASAALFPLFAARVEAEELRTAEAGVSHVSVAGSTM